MGCLFTTEVAPKSDKNTHKILCLGVGGCGKTTFIKQIKILFNVPWDATEIENFKRVIRANYINGIQEALDLCKKLGIQISEENEDKAKQFYAFRARQADFSPEQLSLIRDLGSDPAIQEVIKLHNEKLGVTHLQYFIENLDRISKDDYYPIDEDIIRARMRTSVISSASIYVDNSWFEFVDVGGQKPDRRQWEILFKEQNFTAIIYFVATDEFDVEDEEKEFDRTKMEISRYIWREILSTDGVKEKVPIFLFLNRSDLFEARFKDPAGFQSFKQTFPDFKGTNANKEQGLAYIRDHFLAFRDSPEQPITPHYTCALDRNHLEVVWKGIQKNIIDSALRQAGLLI